MRIENGYLQQGVLCGKKDNRNVVGNFFDVMNKKNNKYYYICINK